MCPIDGQDEIGQMDRSFNEIIASLNTIVENERPSGVIDSCYFLLQQVIMEIRYTQNKSFPARIGRYWSVRSFFIIGNKTEVNKYCNIRRDSDDIFKRGFA